MTILTFPSERRADVDSNYLDPAFAKRIQDEYRDTGSITLEYRLSDYYSHLCCDIPREYGLYEPDVSTIPPFTTWREYLRFTGSPWWVLWRDWEIPLSELDDKLGFSTALELWGPEQTPQGSAFLTLMVHEVGTRFITDTGTIGEVRFHSSPCPGNDHVGVNVSGLVSLACLQWVLDEKETGIKLQIRPWAPREDLWEGVL